ncbi:MAG: hypothetical protein F3741_06745 [Nitrospinae bacterium]|nr:hypothetical protein [Nitrospinota bacterium]MZH40447.1 hypothetical protein [Nitrospinota bacterium]MZH46128.1 hypothetical protein [Nitrospinota bacterium]
MKKILFAILLLVIGMLFSTSTFAHDGEEHHMERYEEGSGSSMDMGHEASGMAHEYRESGKHSKEYYEKKYGKYDHEKHQMEHSLQEEGSGMKEDAHQMMQKEMHERKEEGSRM